MSKHIQYGKTFGLFYDSYRKYCHDNSPTGKPTSETAQIYHDWFISNFLQSIYIYCFPECLVDGAPHNVKTFNNHYLSTSEKVVEASERAEGGLVIPHFRRGYFKRLSSDFYKNKKEQIVFVHETIVNGQAKTLEEK